MVLESQKCLICGKSFDSVQKTVFPRKHSSVFEAWKSECARATSEVLLGEKSDYFASYFQNANYCTYCEKLVRDMSFTWKQIQSFQNRLENLSVKIVKRLDSNYEKIKDKSHQAMVQDKISLILGTDVVPVKIPEYSYEEMIEIIYSVSSRAQLNNFPIRCWNLNSSFFNHSKLDHVSGNSIVGLDVIPTSSPVYIKNEEHAENEDYLQERLLDNSTEENQVQIKTERSDSDSGQEWLNEKIVNDDFEEEDLLDENDDENSSSSGNEYDIKNKTRRKQNLQYRILKPDSGSKKGKPQKLQNEGYKKNFRHMFYCTEENCKKRCISEENLEIHIKKVHRGEKLYECEKCQKRFTSQPHLMRHMADVHNKEKSGSSNKLTKIKIKRRPIFRYNYECKFCCKGYKEEEEMNAHYAEAHQGPNPFTCAFCPEIYSNSVDLRTHMESIHPDPNIIAGKCQKRFTSQPHLMRHKADVHNKEKSGSSNKLMKIKRRPIFRYNYECKFCCKGYKEEEEMNAHYTEAHQGPNPFTCAFCPEIYSNSVDLRTHMESIHPDPNLIAGKLKCETCGRYFATSITLQLHSLSHADKNLLFKCHLCPSVFKQRYYLNKHLEDHSGERKYTCETCGKSYKSLMTLYSHARTHDESRRKWKCKMCDKKFFTRVHCTNHERTHINMKEFVCHICGKGFNLKVNMTQHLKIHKGLPTRRPRPKPRS